MKKSQLLLLIVLFLIVAIQLVPVKRDNPPVTAEMPDTEPVKAILQNSCFDCHSNSTNWPWYSYIAPVSWLVSHDVQEGREYLNFSDWGTFNTKQVKYYKQGIWTEIDKNRMPIKPYLMLHPKAKLSADDRAAIRSWYAAPDSSESTGL